jgi:hypothetical protein
VSVVTSDPCSIQGFCGNTTGLSQIEVLHVTSQALETTDLSLQFVSYTPGALRFTTAYLENDVAVPSTAILLSSSQTEANRGGLGACTSMLASNIRSWSCHVTIPPGETIQLSVTVPNTLDVNKPITKTLSIQAPGEPAA